MCSQHYMRNGCGPQIPILATRKLAAARRALRKFPCLTLYNKTLNLWEQNPASATTLSLFGCEDFMFDYDKEEGPGLYAPMEAMMVTANQANTADMAHHHAHAGATLHSKPAARTNPFSLRTEEDTFWQYPAH